MDLTAVGIAMPSNPLAIKPYHFAFTCPAYSALRGESGLDFSLPLSNILQDLVQGKDGTLPRLDFFVDVWYRQWCLRMQHWRTTHDKSHRYMFLGGTRFRHVVLSVETDDGFSNDPDVCD